MVDEKNKENNSVLAGRPHSLPRSFWLSSLPSYGLPRSLIEAKINCESRRLIRVSYGREPRSENKFLSWHDYPWKSCTAVIHDMITHDLDMITRDLDMIIV